jgi:hypothetical protein
MFKLEKEIISQDGVLHFRRWRILSTPWFGVYLHRIYHHDCDLHMHTHPWDFVSWVISGRYIERLLRNSETSYVARRRWSWAKRLTTDSHQIVDIKAPTTTIVFTGPRHDSWGYNIDGEIVDHQEYREMKNDREH